MKILMIALSIITLNVYAMDDDEARIIVEECTFLTELGQKFYTQKLNGVKVMDAFATMEDFVEKGNLDEVMAKRVRDVFLASYQQKGSAHPELALKHWDDAVMLRCVMGFI